MSAPLLYGERPPNAEAFILAHLLPLAGAVNKLGSKRWAAGMPTPYRMVTRVAGPTDDFSDYPTIRVHTFGATYTEASHAANDTDARMRILIRDPQTDVVMADGRLANCEWCEHADGPTEVPYSAEAVVTRFVSEYRLALSFVAV